MKSKVGPLEPGGVRRLSICSICGHFYFFLVTLGSLLLDSLLRMLLFLANKYHFGQKILPRNKGRVKAKDLVTGRFLGQGCSGIFYETVWTGWLQGSLARLARKDFPGVKGDIFESEVVRLFELREHPNVVKTFCWTVDSRSCSLVMEYMKDNLSSFVRRKKEASMNEPKLDDSSPPPFELLEAIDIALQIATGVEHLHEEGIPHGDLKPNNVLIDWKEGRMVVKVADFGLIETKRRTTLTSQRALCFRMIEWSAPEVLEDYFASIEEDLDYIWTPSLTGIPSASDCDEKIMMELADSYSFALTCAYIFGGENDRLCKRISSSGCWPELPSECPEKLASLISKCWDVNPKRRPTFTVICHELQEIVKEQREQEEQLKMRNMMQAVVKEREEVLRQQETLSNTLQMFVKEKEKLQEGMLDIRIAMQDSKKDIMEQLQKFCIQLQEIFKVLQDSTADSNPLKPVELLRLNSPTPEAFSADSSKISCLDPDPARLERRKGKALVSEYSEAKECITCTREREGFSDLNDQIQTDSERADDVGPSDQFRVARESKPGEVNVLSLTRTTESLVPRPEIRQVEHHLVGMEGHVNTRINKLEKFPSAKAVLGILDTSGVGLVRGIYKHIVGYDKSQSMRFSDIDENPPSCIEVETSLLTKLRKVLSRDIPNAARSRVESYQYPFHKLSTHSPLVAVEKRSNFDEPELNKSLLAPGSSIIVTSQNQHPLKTKAREYSFSLHKGSPLPYEIARMLIYRLRVESILNLENNWTQLFEDRDFPDMLKSLGSRLEALPGLGQLRALESLQLLNCKFLPTSMGLWAEEMGILTNLKELQLHNCDQIRELPSSIGQLKVLESLDLRSWSSLEALPDSLGHLRNLQSLWIVKCTLIANLPTSIGLLPNLRVLIIQGCSKLQSLPDSMTQLSELERLMVLDCRSLENSDALRVLMRPGSPRIGN